MVQAAELSALTHGLSAEGVERVRALVQAIGCPVQAPDLGEDPWLEHMQVDKQNEGDQLRFVLLPALGRAQCEGVHTAALRHVLTQLDVPATSPEMSRCANASVKPMK